MMGNVIHLITAEPTVEVDIHVVPAVEEAEAEGLFKPTLGNINPAK